MAFPYVAYENGGGAFLIPYLLALITAGLPLLFLDYAVGHRSTGSPPKAYRALFKGGETLGWWQVCVCIIIGLYYASVLTWAGSYIYFSIGQMWEVTRKASSSIPIYKPQKRLALICSL